MPHPNKKFNSALVMPLRLVVLILLYTVDIACGSHLFGNSKVKKADNFALVLAQT